MPVVVVRVGRLATESLLCSKCFKCCERSRPRQRDGTAVSLLWLRSVTYLREARHGPKSTHSFRNVFGSVAALPARLRRLLSLSCFANGNIVARTFRLPTIGGRPALRRGCRALPSAHRRWRGCCRNLTEIPAITGKRLWCTEPS